MHWSSLLFLILLLSSGKVMVAVDYEHILSYLLPQYPYLFGLTLFVLTLFRVIKLSIELINININLLHPLKMYSSSIVIGD